MRIRTDRAEEQSRESRGDATATGPEPNLRPGRFHPTADDQLSNSTWVHFHPAHELSEIQSRSFVSYFPSSVSMMAFPEVNTLTNSARELKASTRLTIKRKNKSDKSEDVLSWLLVSRFFLKERHQLEDLRRGG